MSKKISAVAALALGAGFAGAAVAESLMPVPTAGTAIIVEGTTKEGVSTHGTYWKPGCIQAKFTYLGTPQEGADMNKILTNVWQDAVSQFTIEDIVKDGMNRIFSGKVRSGLEAAEEAMSLTAPGTGFPAIAKYQGWTSFEEGACKPKP